MQMVAIDIWTVKAVEKRWVGLNNDSGKELHAEYWVKENRIEIKLNGGMLHKIMHSLYNRH